MGKWLFVPPNHHSCATVRPIDSPHDLRRVVACTLQQRVGMKRCDSCGNTYDKAFEITMDGSRYTFDCFECAVHKLAPKCRHCGCKIIGHGTEASGVMFCSAYCARYEGVEGVSDRAV
jgi:hypothetical protein